MNDKLDVSGNVERAIQELQHGLEVAKERIGKHKPITATAYMAVTISNVIEILREASDAVPPVMRSLPSEIPDCMAKFDLPPDESILGLVAEILEVYEKPDDVPIAPDSTIARLRRWYDQARQ